jgi:myo-inositol-1(or 4)-monophosphatase
MREYRALLDVSIQAAQAAFSALTNSDKLKQHSYSQDIPRELKAEADKILEQEILEKLLPLGLPVLTEEQGEIGVDATSGLKFVVDPLDGTVNFVRGLGGSSICIALCENNQPIFGVLCTIPDGDIIWGGKGMGAYQNELALNVSNISNLAESVVCTGFPARFPIEDTDASKAYIKRMSSFAKVRMLGSAALSLQSVARGSAEVYMEENIMLWDVAAGLAIVEGAGGVVSVSNGSVEKTINVVATNGHVSI